MTDLSDGGRLWLGGWLLDGTWSWSDGTPWDYENWAPGEPSGDGNCLEIRYEDGTWNDLRCDNINVSNDIILGYVCKKY